MITPEQCRAARGLLAWGQQDLAEAKSQSTAMAKAKVTLKAALDKAVSQNAGYRAISIFPSLKDGHPVGTVELLKDQEFKTIEIPLE